MLACSHEYNAACDDYNPLWVPIVGVVQPWDEETGHVLLEMEQENATAFCGALGHCLQAAPAELGHPGETPLKWIIPESWAFAHDKYRRGGKDARDV